MLETIETQDISTREFNAHDRCDSCQAQAYFAVEKLVNDKVLDLLLCSHHRNKFADRLLTEGWSFHKDEAALRELTKAPAL